MWMLSQINCGAAALLTLLTGCTSVVTAATEPVALSQLNPQGYSFAASCRWTFQGMDSGREQNCDELYLSDKVAPSDAHQLSANLAATCFSFGPSARLSREKCTAHTERSCTCEGDVSKKTGHRLDARIFQRSTKFWPEANQKALTDWRQDSSRSAYSCVCTKDVF